ncbi:3-hydroxyacyl-ACP dehydratase [Flavobacterium aciduliphilum]|uniref:3-hydroxyacyl-[acyl-carrier-protein] dehydratase n=1 Tax=Flavobacterium aciduliphilum TaxID=1101402 RepID=A0A328YC36_9FLAO|nr:3-hydroxyacyl-ACP dehydratase [Flavobacterium aciduliphilum]RAR71538.1 3-hydroxyacyl-[acyl-carrier-protein] dehydratase [Flavobacterium aciduliphilum]
MLLKDFYKVEKLERTDEGKYIAVVFLNKEHDIFKGHFPGNPVTPGVCMMQIIKELTQNILGSYLIMTSSTNVKFMALINPEKNSILKLDLEISGNLTTEIKVKNTTSFDETVALKLTNVYKSA